MRPAAAQVRSERLAHVVLGRLWIAIEQRFRAHDHPIDAVTALCRLLLDEGALQGMWLLETAEALERRDLGVGERADVGHTGAHRLAVDQHRAGAALRHAAPEL